MKNDMTTGNSWKLILSFMVPVLLGNLFQNLYSIVDSIIVGRMLGMEAFAAVGVTAAQGFIVHGWISGMTSGFAIILSQEYGAKREEKVRHFFMMSLFLSLVMCVIMTAGLLGSNTWVLSLMKTPDNIFAMSKAYIQVIYGGIFATIGYGLLSGVLRAFGDSRTPLVLLLISSVLNVVLDIVFIRYFHMGVEGTAYATVIAQLVSAVLCFIHMSRHYQMFRFSGEEWKIRGGSIWHLLKIGFPMALQFSITGISVLIVQGAINSFGALHIAAISTVGKIQGVIGQPMVALGVTLSTFTGQNYGARKLERVKEGVKIGIVICVVTGLLCTAVIYLFGSRLIPVFIKDDVTQIMTIAQQYFNVIAWFYVPLSLIYVYRNTLQGLGEGFVPFLGGVFELLARIIAIGLLVKPLGFYGVVLSDPMAWMFALIPLVPYYYIRMRRISNGWNRK